MYTDFMSNDNLLQELSSLCAGFFETSSWEQLLHKILTTSIHATKADRGTIFIADELDEKSDRKQNLTSLIATGLGPKKISIAANQGIAGYVFTTQSALIENDAMKNQMFLSNIDSETSYETKKILAIPLVTPSGKKLESEVIRLKQELQHHQQNDYRKKYEEKTQSNQFQ